MAKFNIFVNLAFIIYIIFLLRLAVFRDSFTISKVFEAGKYNLSLFSDLTQIYKNDKAIFCMLFFGNLGWFFPFGAFLNYKDIDILKATIFGILFSLFVEISQYTFKSGIFEIDDLVLNTIGAFLGAVCVSFLKDRYDNKI